MSVRRLAAVHRGLSLTGESRYRNPPLWRIPIELKRRFPSLPLLCSPRHICGRARLVPPIAQEALDLLYDGLMIEVHPDPSNAPCDGPAQVDFAGLDRLLAEIVAVERALGRR